MLKPFGLKGVEDFKSIYGITTEQLDSDWLNIVKTILILKILMKVN